MGAQDSGGSRFAADLLERLLARKVAERSADAVTFTLDSPAGDQGWPGRCQVRVRYALRNALLPVVTTLGMVFGFMLGSSVIVEKVFGWPGVGSYAIDALTASDYAPVQGFVLTMALLYTLLNLAIDLLYVVIDPRVRLGS